MALGFSGVKGALTGMHFLVDTEPQPVPTQKHKRSVRNSPRRITPQQQQETLSRSQLEEALADWICNSHQRDVGEDFTVSIYDEGRSTGINFLLQLKSTRDWKGLVSAKYGNNIRISLKVKDLTHWEDTSPPVVVAIWDVTARIGFWQDVPAIVKALDAQGSGWRKQSSVTVSVLPSQIFDKCSFSA